MSCCLYISDKKADLKEGAMDICGKSYSYTYLLYSVMLSSGYRHIRIILECLHSQKSRVNTALDERLMLFNYVNNPRPPVVNTIVYSNPLGRKSSTWGTGNNCLVNVALQFSGSKLRFTLRMFICIIISS